MEGARFFYNHREAVFVRRPNRFLIIASAGGEEFPCHCPNPGRLLEFLFPGTPLILEKRDAGNRKAKTGWTVVGLRYRNGTIVPLFSARANRVAEALVLPHIIPSLREVHPEYTIGDSRFDFLCLDKNGKRHLVEVKSCSLVEEGTAMFPDAPSERAGKHARELEELGGDAYNCHVLFLIGHSDPARFVPNVHTDAAFASTLFFSRRTAFHAASVRVDENGMAALVNPAVPVDLSCGGLSGENRGSYMIVLNIPRAADIEIGALAVIHFEAGWYVYCGSAQKNLSRRVARHLVRVRKAKHWHLDYLTPFASSMKALPIVSEENLECLLASECRKLGGRAVPRFGSSDCPCESHLFFFTRPPMETPAFVGMLLKLRHNV